MSADLQTIITVVAFIGTLIASYLNYKAMRKSDEGNRQKLRLEFLLGVRLDVIKINVKYKELLAEGTSNPKFDFQGWHTNLISALKSSMLSTGDPVLIEIANNDLTEYATMLKGDVVDLNEISYIKQNLEALEKIMSHIGTTINSLVKE